MVEWGKINDIVVGPARAGMIRININSGRTRRGWPRTSGDDPSRGLSEIVTVMLAPHERG